jgi:hypothetical protein
MLSQTSEDGLSPSSTLTFSGALNRAVGASEENKTVYLGLRSLTRFDPGWYEAGLWP